MKYFYPTVLFVAVCLTLAACSNDSNGDNNNNNNNTVGTASMEVSGAHSETADATANSTPHASGDGWGILFGTATADICCFVISVETGGRPSPGTYPIVDVSTGTTPGAGEFMAVLTAGGGNYVSTGGTVTISSSSSSTVEGSFDFTASNILNTSSTIDVEGTFNARNTDN